MKNEEAVANPCYSRSRLDGQEAKETQRSAATQARLGGWRKPGQMEKVIGESIKGGSQGYRASHCSNACVYLEYCYKYWPLMVLCGESAKVNDARSPTNNAASSLYSDPPCPFHVDCASRLSTKGSPRIRHQANQPPIIVKKCNVTPTFPA